MLSQLRNRYLMIVVGVDSACFAFSLWFAYLMRFEFALADYRLKELLIILPWVVALKVLVFFFLGAYRGLWRYTSLVDVLLLVRASALSSLILIGGLTVMTRFHGYSRAIFLMDGIFTCFICSGSRAFIRMIYTIRWPCNRNGRSDSTSRTRRLIVIGAGDAAEKIIREISENKQWPYTVVCCLDDQPGKIGRSLHGAPIFGAIDRLPECVVRFRADEVLICIPSLFGEKMREIVELARISKVPCRILPPLSSRLHGQVSVNDVREVGFEDLLGRSSVPLDVDGIGSYLTDKVVLVTGGGGSIGSELCRQILLYHPRRLIVLDAGEFNLYAIDHELRLERKSESVLSLLGRVQDPSLMTRIFDEWRPSVVFHAAAYKHVPMLEAHPWEAVFNNIVGSRLMMNLAEQYGVERFVFVSTDKAVRPTNVMGASKRAVEMLLQAKAGGNTRFMAVRFGNVLGSSGSVIPLFQRQILNGGPVTVTHPDMTRFFMTISEASQLILQAGAMGRGGEIFVLEMGKPVNIAAMARDLIRLSGKEVDADVAIVFTGLRPGEKLYEELMTQDEGIGKTSHPKIMVLRRGPNGPTEAEIEARVQVLVDAAMTYDARKVKAALRLAVPEYRPMDPPAAMDAAPPVQAEMARQAPRP